MSLIKGRSCLFMALSREREGGGGGEMKGGVFLQLISGQSDFVRCHLLSEVNQSVLPHNPVHTHIG